VNPWLCCPQKAHTPGAAVQPPNGKPAFTASQGRTASMTQIMTRINQAHPGVVLEQLQDGQDQVVHVAEARGLSERRDDDGHMAGWRGSRCAEVGEAGRAGGGGRSRPARALHTSREPAPRRASPSLASCAQRFDQHIYTPKCPQLYTQDKAHGNSEQPHKPPHLALLGSAQQANRAVRPRRLGLTPLSGGCGRSRMRCIPTPAPTRTRHAATRANVKPFAIIS
jgi:hypothetical protein